MAKTFKNLPRPGEPSAPSKPTSELDFFDLTDKPTKPATAAKAAATGNNIGNINNTSNIGNTGNTTLSKGSQTAAAASEGDARQTFVVGRRYLEQLRDFVHARRTKGDYTYSQKQALQEALDLLFASDGLAAPRPAQAREREQQRRLRIQQGRRSTTGE